MNRHIKNRIYTKDSPRCISFSREPNLRHSPNITCKSQKQNNTINTPKKVDCGGVDRLIAN
jgi:hypothetical protein